MDGMRWCTVTVTDAEGRRHSVDVQATSTFDAPHLFVVEAKKERAVGLPKPTLATVFEVVAAARSTTSAEQRFRGGLSINEVRGKGPRATCFARGQVSSSTEAIRAARGISRLPDVT